MTECEKKLLLSEEAYNALMERFSSAQKQIVTQINYYFDTDDFAMNRRNTTCRIRLKDGQYQATMKRHAAGTDQSTETEMEIYAGLDHNAFTDMGLKLWGALTTHRCVLLKNPHLEVVLDRNEYLGYTDYELEIEYLPEYEKEARAILKRLRDILKSRQCTIIYKGRNGKPPSVPSKSSRFFKRISTTNTTPQPISKKGGQNEFYSWRNLHAQKRRTPDN